jgi:uncharacterized membrane protein YdfJ with MMPL/SSD domain
MKVSTGALAAASARHPWRVIGAWIAAVVAAFVLVGVLLGDALTTEYLPTNNPESIRARDAVDAAFPPAAGAQTTELVVVRSERYTVDDPEFESFVRGLVLSGGAPLAGAPTYLSDEAAPVSEDRRATLIAFEASKDTIGGVLTAVSEAAEGTEFTVAVTGLETIDHDYNLLAQDDLKTGELQFGLPAALVILLLVFGTVVAGLVPLVMAIVSIVVALGMVAVLAQVTELSVFIVNMLVAMGLALGIDYSLFVISRYREERGQGRPQHEAIEVAGQTASRAVVFSGTAFVVAMFGMFIVPNSVMRSLAVGAILVGIVSVAAAVTLLPAALGLLGDRVDALRIPFFGRKSFERTNPEGRFWGTIVRSVLRRPGLSFAVSVAALLLLASPVLGMTIGSRGVSTLPDRFQSKQGFEALERYFPQATTEPVQIVVDGDAGRPEVSGSLDSLTSALAVDSRFGDASVRTSADGDVAVLAVPIEGDPRGDDAMAAVRDLRAEIVPASFADTDAVVLVGGRSAEQLDYVDSVTDPVPFVIALVLGLTFILLTVVFRSVVIAGTAVFLNLLSVGAAYGLLVVVFQWGWGVGLLGFEQADSIEAWVPLFLFAVLFGLSMDYQVFLLSRIRERYDQTGDTSDAVYFGVSSTARIITGAALIIVAVFAGFARGELIEFQQMGFGVGVALLLDATVIRGVVLPSTMRLLGEWNWYLPRWLRWIPEVHVEGGRELATAPAGASTE